VRFVRRFIPVVMPSSLASLIEIATPKARRFRKQTKRLYLQSQVTRINIGWHINTSQMANE
jgi:hypothetical protein